MLRCTDVTLGERFGPAEFELTEELQRRYSQNDLPEYASVADPTIAGNLAIRVLGARYPGSIIHSHQSLGFFAPVQVGETVVATAELTRTGGMGGIASEASGPPILIEPVWAEPVGPEPLACAPLLTQTIGATWIERGEIDATFTRPVYPGDTINVAATRTPDGAYDVRATNQHGDLVMIASARMRDG